MTAPLSREEMIAEIRTTFPRPPSAAGKTADQLEALEPKALLALYEKLSRLAVRKDLQARSTPQTAARRQANKARLKAALRKLDGLKHGSTKPGTEREPEPILPKPVGMDASLVAWQDRRRQWIDTAAVERSEQSVARFVEEELRNSAGAEVSVLLRGFIDDATQAAVRKILETSQLEVARLLRSKLLELPHIHHTLSSGVVEQLVQENVATALEPVWVEHAHRRLPPSRALDGLAKLQAYAIDFAPDFIYVPDNGSQIVGQFLVAELKTRRHGPSPHLWRRGRLRPTVTKQETRFLFVADFAVQAEQFETFKREVRKLHGNQVLVRFAVLVGSADLHDKLTQGGAALVTHVAPDGTNAPPWDRSGAYSREDDNHVFGAGTDALRVSPPLLDPAPFLEELAGPRVISGK